MNKLKSLAPWLVAMVLGVLLVSGIARASGGFSWTNVEELVAQKIFGQLPSEEQGMIGASGTRMPNGISADSTSPSAGQVRGTTLTITGAASTGALSPSTLTVGTGGSAMDLVVSTLTTTLDFAAIAAGTCAELPFTVTGASTGDSVAISVSSTVVGDSATWMGYVSSANTVSIRGCNVSSTVSTANFAASTFRATVFSF